MFTVPNRTLTRPPESPHSMKTPEGSVVCRVFFFLCFSGLPIGQLAHRAQQLETQTAEWFFPLRISNPDLFSELPTWSMDRLPQTPSTSQAESLLNSLPDPRQSILLSVWTSSDPCALHSLKQRKPPRFSFYKFLQIRISDHNLSTIFFYISKPRRDVFQTASNWEGTSFQRRV